LGTVAATVTAGVVAASEELVTVTAVRRQNMDKAACPAAIRFFIEPESIPCRRGLL
jgi:hypothetical protein